jgi:hypothetical protein
LKTLAIWSRSSPSRTQIALFRSWIDHGHDVKWLIQTILTMHAYQMPSVPRPAEAAGGTSSPDPTSVG